MQEYLPDITGMEALEIGENALNALLAIRNNVLLGTWYKAIF
jgi:hypothetical protein